VNIGSLLWSRNVSTANDTATIVKRRIPLRRFRVVEGSMLPALIPGRILWAVPLHRPRRGDVICFPHPDRPDFWLVKRVIGLPGEQVAIAHGKVRIDGTRLTDPWGVGPTLPDGRWLCRPGEVFVLSDARSVTRADSRSFGPVEIRRAYRWLDGLRKP